MTTQTLDQAKAEAFGGQMVARHSRIRYSSKDGVRNEGSNTSITVIISHFITKTTLCLLDLSKTPTSISGGSSVASGGVESPSEGSMASFSLPSSLQIIFNCFSTVVNAANSLSVA